MRHFLLLGAIALLALGAPSAQERDSGPQKLEIGIIDFYGRLHVTADEARAALAIKEGDLFDPEATEPPASFRTTAERLKSLPDVLHVSMSPICCDAGRLILFIGIEERGAPTPRHRKPPTGDDRLPEDVIAAGRRFAKVFGESVQRGDNGEDLSRGHSLANDPATRAVQEEFLGFARRDLPLLKKVLRKSSDTGHRALAAQVIGYAPDKQAVVDDLLSAMQDPEEAVRNNAMRALLVFAEATRQAQAAPGPPGPGAVAVRVPAGPFVEFLHSPEWTDRNKAAGALMALTATRERATLVELRRTALGPLTEMAQWKSAGHALPAYTILARIAGTSDEEAKRLWDEGNRRTVIDAAAASRG